MSVQIIQERLEQYHCTSDQEEQYAVREISQEIALLGLSRAGFFKHGAFQGGTCLRILYGLDRFSEDLDFALLKPEFNFQWQPFLRSLDSEFSFYGYDLNVQDAKPTETIRKVFLKDRSIQKLLTFHHRKSRRGREREIKIKLEIDTNPPQGAGHSVKYLEFPLSFSVTAHDLRSLFGGKIHALLCRTYVRGRDWFDFLWYTARKTSINYPYLSSALDQQGPWKGKGVVANKDWCIQELHQKVESLDWKVVREDVARFLKARELETLNLWSRDFFVSRLEKMSGYLAD